MAEKKKKALSADEVKERLGKAKEKLVEAKDSMLTFCKENGLKKADDHSNHEDAKISKSWKAKKAEIDEAVARVEKYTGLYKDAKKASKGSAGVKAKYSYPKDVKTGDDKKKYRAETRAKAKKLGITVDEFLTDVEGNNKKYKALAAEKEKSKSDGEGKKKKKEEPKKKKRKVADAADESDEEEESTEEEEEEEDDD